MKARNLLKAAAFALGLIGVSAAAPAVAQTLAPIEAYARLPAVSDVAISPDGRHIIMQQSDSSASAFRIVDLTNQQSVYSSRIEAPNVLSGVGWADNNTATFEVLSTQNQRWVGQRVSEFSRTGIYSLQTSRYTYLLDDIPLAQYMTGMGGLSAPIVGDEGYGRMQAIQREGDEFRVIIYRVNLRSGRSTVADRGDGNDAWDYLLDERGQIAARVDADRETNQWELYGYVGGTARLLKSGSNETGSPPSLRGLLPDGRLVVNYRTADRVNHFVSINMSDGTEADFLSDHPGSTCVVNDPWTGRIVGVCWQEDFDRYRFTVPQLTAAQSMLNEMFSDGFARLVSWSQDYKKFVVYGETSQDGGGFYIFEPEAGNILQVGMRYPELTGSNFGVRQQITFRARDGVQVPAYLTRPVANARSLPLVVFVHGGPHGVRDDFEFNTDVSFLASRGYAVLQVNYRGSGGYGQQWQEAGYRNWGDGLMQTDVLDGVDALVRGGIADPRRMCIMGASYGGYAALAGVTLTPDKFACAIAISGPADLVQMLEDVTFHNSRGGDAEWWVRSIGDLSTQRDHIRAISPTANVASVRVPILLMHGNEDSVVPVTQSRRMNELLRAAGKDVRYVELTGDDHWGTNPAARTVAMREIEQFLARTIGPNAARPAGQ